MLTGGNTKISSVKTSVTKELILVIIAMTLMLTKPKI